MTQKSRIEDRETLARRAVDDILAAVPILQGIVRLNEVLELDRPDEARLDMFFSIATGQALVMQSILALMEQEVEVLYAIRERNRQQHNVVDSDHSEQSGP